MRGGYFFSYLSRIERAYPILWKVAIICSAIRILGTLVGSRILPLPRMRITSLGTATPDLREELPFDMIGKLCLKRQLPKCRALHLSLRRIRRLRRCLKQVSTSDT